MYSFRLSTTKTSACVQPGSFYQHSAKKYLLKKAYLFQVLKDTTFKIKNSSSIFKFFGFFFYFFLSLLIKTVKMTCVFNKNIRVASTTIYLTTTLFYSNPEQKLINLPYQRFFRPRPSWFLLHFFL